MPSFSFQRLKTELGRGFDWTTADVRILLLDEALAPDPDPLAATLDAVTDDELETTGYVRKAVAGRSIGSADVDSLARWLADAVVWPTLGPGPTVGGAIVFVQITDDSDSWPALFLADVEGETNGSSFTVTFSALGVVTVGDG